MTETQNEPLFMNDLRALVQGDGLDLEYLGTDSMAGTLKLRLTEGPNPCAACVMSRELLEDIALTTVQKTDPRIRKVLVRDERPNATTQPRRTDFKL
jgi:Fe-S cluster biogenesis protein NfuA